MKAVVVIGRFNPLTKGHCWMIDTAIQYAERVGASMFLLPTRSEGNERNPIDYNSKLKYISSIYKDKCNIVSNSNIKTLFNLIDYLKENGYNEFIGFGDEERKELYERAGIKFISMGDRKDVSEGILSISGTKVRKLCEEGRFNDYLSCMPLKMPLKYINEIYRKIRK